MVPIEFSYVNSRKRALQGNIKREKISLRTVSKNLNYNNLLLFTESVDNDMDYHCKQSFLLYDRLLSENADLSNNQKRRIEWLLASSLNKVNDIDNITSVIECCNNISDKTLFFNTLDNIDHCDRILRNDSKIAKRFDFSKTIDENILKGCRHTVFELCSLIDTYSLSSKAKLNISLENVLYSLFKSGHDVDLNEAAEYIVEYFFTRDIVITDKEYDGYIDVLENNKFIDSDNKNISYVFEAKNTVGMSYTDKAHAIITQSEDEKCAKHIKQILDIKNEKQASKYIDDTLEMILNDDISKTDSMLLLKSIYILPLIGHISKNFVNYKLEMSRKKVKIKQKLTKVSGEKAVRDVLDDGELIDYVSFVSEGIHFENYILDDEYKETFNILEASGTSDEIEDIIKSFKASNDKSTSKFINMIRRIMTKSPENIIDETPNIFAAVRIMLYLAIAGSFTLGPIFAIILALINKLITTHLDLKQAEKLLAHLKSEKEKAEKKLEKLSGKEKENQEEYIECIDKCIKKVKAFIEKIDDEALEDDDYDFSDFGFDDDFNFESCLLEFESPQKVLNMLAEFPEEDILSTIAPLFDNCSNIISNSFYKLVEDKSINESTIERYSNRIESNVEEPSFVVRYEAAMALQEILEATQKNNKNQKQKDQFNLNTIKMAVINFKKKFRDLKGKEQELWRNIDIATVHISKGIQKALTSDRREAIIKGSIIPSFSKMIKSAITVGAVGAFTGPTGAVITAVGMFAASKYLNERERRLLYDEIDTELQVVEKQIQLAENEGDMNQYRFLLNYQKKLTREKHRIKYGIHMSGRTIPEIRKGGND